LKVSELISGLSVKITNGLIRNYLNDVEKLANATDYDLMKIGHDFQIYHELRIKAKAYINHNKEVSNE